VTRYPDVGAGPAHDELPYRHVVARVDHADLTQVGAAAVLCGDSVTDDDLLRCWPHAVLVAEARDGGCRVRTRAGDDVLLRTRGRTVVDPWVLASWAYWRVCRDEPLAGSARLRSGRTVVTVVAEAW